MAGHRYTRGFRLSEPLMNVVLDAHHLLNGTTEVFRTHMDRVLEALREGHLHEVDYFVNQAVDVLSQVGHELSDEHKTEIANFANLVRSRAKALAAEIESDLTAEHRPEPLSYYAHD